MPTGLTRRAVVALVAAEFFLTLDGSAVTVALPTIRDHFDLDAGPLQWIVIVYMIAAAATALPLGALGDRLGKSTVLTGSLAVFLVGALVTGTAPSLPVLLAGRALAGVGASGILVLSLALLTAGVAEARVPRVVAWWTAAGSAASVVAPAVSGLVVVTAGWRWLFLIAAVPALLVLVATRSSLGRSESGSGDAVDWWSSALATLATILIVGAITAWSSDSAGGAFELVLLLTGVATGWLFWRRQRTPGHRLTDWRPLRTRPIPVLLGLRWLLSFLFVGVAYQQTMLLQNGLGYSPLKAGALDIPPALAATAAAAGSAWLGRRWGLHLATGAGFGLMAVGIGGLALGDLQASLLILIGSFLLIGTGFGLNTSLLSSGILGELPVSSRGAGSGALSLLNQLASVLGIAVVGAAVSWWVTRAWADRGAQTCSGNDDLNADVIVGSLAEIRRLCGPHLEEVAREAYFDGITDALLAVAILLTLTAAAATVLLRRARLPQPD
ncbi:MAG: MFS transporter [Candidatus Nanopelagicales bacterium]